MEYKINSHEALRLPSKVFMLVEAPLGYLLTFPITHSLYSNAKDILVEKPRMHFLIPFSLASRYFS